MQSPKSVITVEFLGSVLVVLCGFYLTNGKITDVHPAPSLHLSPAALKSFLTRVLQQNASMRACPAPKYPLEDNDCNLPTCHKDEDCGSQNQSCCFNGCIFTCVDRLAPPPVIDWDEEPRPPPVRDGEDAVLRCSTVPRPAPSEPVGCPRGYVCSLDDDEDSPDSSRTPTTIGICVPEAADLLLGTEPEKEFGIKEKTRKQTVYLPGGCVLSENQYKNVQDFKTKPYVVDCFCVDGSIECQINGEKK